MKKWLKWCLCVFLTLPVCAGAAEERNSGQSEEIDRLRKIIMEEQQVIAQCMKRIDALEATKAAQDKAGLNNLKLYGDFRYRYESIHQDPEKAIVTGARGGLMKPQKDDTRDRHRIRLRLGADYLVNPEVTVSAQLATAMGGDPVSTNQTLTSGFSQKDIWLDLAYFDYHPVRPLGLKVLGGRMKNPYFTPGQTQLIWDQDLRPEGLAATYAYTNLLPWELKGTVGYFQVEERSVDRDATLLGLQAMAKYNLLEDGRASILGGLSYYDYTGAEGYPPFFAAADNFGNSLNSAVLNGLGLYADDFELIEAFLEFTYPIGRYPLTVYGDYVVNTAANDNFFDTGDDDTGWAAGLAFNRCALPRSWALRYEYRDVERDAVVGAFTDSDFGGGGTNARGHILGAEYMLLKNVRLATTYFINESRGSDLLRLLPTWGAKENVDGDYRRLMLDVNFKF